MEKRTLGKTNLSVSVLGFGAAPIAYLDSQQQRAVNVIELLLSHGVNLIDTAASYPGSEEFLGRHFSRRRSEFVLVSKCGQTIDGVDAPAWSEKTITATVDRALRLLRTDHLDVMLLHSPRLQVLEKGEALAALAKARAAGKTRYIGFSGDNDALVYAAKLPETDVIECSINIVDQINIDRGLPVARRNHIGVIAKRPIANAAWKDLSDQPGMYQDYATEYTQRLPRLNITPSALGFDGDWPELALRFTLSIEGVHSAIIGTTNPENALANVRYAEKGPLPKEIVRKIQDAFRRADPQSKGSNASLWRQAALADQ